MLMRLAWRETHMVPPPPTDIPRWQQVASRFTHWLLYAVLIVQPLSGWASVSASGGSINLFWLVTLPGLTPSKSVANAAGWVHGAVGTAILSLIGLHVLAALRHYLILKDNVL